ncbi:MAG: sulfatase [Puniceicoccaceae bacterium]
MKPKNLAILGLLSCLSLVAHASSKQPNIILMMADDLGWRDLGCYGSELYQTPNLDALAERGVRFSNAYSASPLCSPTRASVLTGQTPGRIHITQPAGHLKKVLLDPIVPKTARAGIPMTEPQSRTRLPLDSVTISQVLKDAGYRTGFMGKWHLGFDPYIPESFGFDVVVGGRGFPGPPPPGYFGPWDPERTNMPLVKGRVHADDVLADQAIAFLKESHGKDEPFFLALWYFDVHAPYVGKEDLIEKYRPLAAKTKYQKSAIMGAMVETLDDNVGKVLDKLEELGMAEDTLVIFTSDNGGNMYDRPEGQNPTNNHPLRAGKGNNHEGGTRVPLIVSWPGKVAQNKQSDTIAISYDFFPTLLEVAGIDPDSDLLLDGVSLTSSFDGSTVNRPPIYSMFGRMTLATGNYSNIWARDGKWKLFKYFNIGPDAADKYALYDLEADPGESNDVSLHFPEVMDRLKTFINRRIKEDGILVPTANPNYDPDMQLKGWSIVDGGYIFGGPTSPVVNILSEGGPVTMHYELSAKARKAGVLVFSVTTNCAISVVAGEGDSPIYGSPQAIVPDMKKQPLTIPLPKDGKAGQLTLVFELEQPGRLFIYP